jgi:hypothetical protein
MKRAMKQAERTFLETNSAQQAFMEDFNEADINLKLYGIVYEALLIDYATIEPPINFEKLTAAQKIAALKMTLTKWFHDYNNSTNS